MQNAPTYRILPNKCACLNKCTPPPDFCLDWLYLRNYCSHRNYRRSGDPWPVEIKQDLWLSQFHRSEWPVVFLAAFNRIAQTGQTIMYILYIQVSNLEIYSRFFCKSGLICWFPYDSAITETSCSFSITERGVKLLKTDVPPLQLEIFGPVNSFSDLQESESQAQTTCGNFSQFRWL